MFVTRLTFTNAQRGKQTVLCRLTKCTTLSATYPTYAPLVIPVIEYVYQRCRVINKGYTRQCCHQSKLEMISSMKLSDCIVGSIFINFSRNVNVIQSDESSEVWVGLLRKCDMQRIEVEVAAEELLTFSHLPYTLQEHVDALPRLLVEFPRLWPHTVAGTVL